MPILNPKLDKAITWNAYLSRPLPACPYKEFKVTLTLDTQVNTEVDKSHPAGISSQDECGTATTISRSHRTLDPAIQKGLSKFLEKQARILVEEDYVQPLLNEQGVAEVYFKNVLAPVKQVLEELILPLLQKDKDIMAAGYSFNVRPQQMPVKKPDHFIVFEHMDGIPNGKGYAPPSRPEWSTPADFATQLAARTAWDREYPNGDGPSKRPEYPRLVLCVIEEKKPNVIDVEAFVTGYKRRPGPGPYNVECFMPQIKKYSVDANCNLVILTDYLTTMVLDVKVAGAELIKGEVKKNDDTPHVSFYVLDTPPRLSIFETAINRLHLAKLLKMDGQEGVILMDPKDRL